jgi:hypothetical protein
MRIEKETHTLDWKMVIKASLVTTLAVCSFGLLYFVAIAAIDVFYDKNIAIKQTVDTVPTEIDQNKILEAIALLDQKQQERNASLEKTIKSYTAAAADIVLAKIDTEGDERDRALSNLKETLSQYRAAKKAAKKTPPAKQTKTSPHKLTLEDPCAKGQHQIPGSIYCVDSKGGVVGAEPYVSTAKPKVKAEKKVILSADPKTGEPRLIGGSQK